MKFTSTSILSLLISLSALAQCPEPELSDWQFSSPNNATIAFNAPEDAVAYELTVIYLYQDSFFSGLDSIQFTDVATAGLNVVEIDPTIDIPQGMLPDNYFYQVKLRIQCTNEEWSGTQQFYMSPLSQLNNPGFICGQPFTIIEYLVDGPGFSVAFELNIPQGEDILEIESMGVLVDIGHTYNGDLSIALTSPQGTTIDLMAYPNGLGGSQGYSVYFTDDAPPLDGPAGFFAPTDPLSTFAGETTHGTWILTVTDNLAIDAGYVFGGCINFNTSPCLGSVSGSAYYDLNSSASYDNEEPLFGNALIQNNLNGDVFFTNSQGNYFRCVQDGPLSLSLANAPQYYASVPGIFTSEIAPGAYLTGADFALTPIGTVVDLHADMFGLMPDRPGFSNQYLVTCTNTGNSCIDNVALEVELDTRLTISDVTGGVPVFSENPATVQLGTFCPFQTTTVTIFQTLSDTVSIGAELLSTATLTPLIDDGNPDDNIFNFTSVVVGSYDPNDKQVSMESIDENFLNEGNYLDYHIRFQNTGTFYAERVVIADTIDTDLNFNSFEFLSASHPVELTNDGRIIYFTFDQIFLPDSASNEPESHGYIRYRIKPTPDFSAGDLIENTAYIYFDFNEPIITNTVVTGWSSGLGLDSYDIIPGVFPNPASTSVTIIWSETAKASTYMFYDLTGREVLNGLIGNGTNEVAINVEGLTPGVYLVYLEGESRFKPMKLVKQ